MKFISYLLGQADFVQAWECVEDPLHAAPLYAGAGLLQDLVLDCVPLPHVTEQLPYDDQLPQFPFTAIVILLH